MVPILLMSAKTSTLGSLNRINDGLFRDCTRMRWWGVQIAPPLSKICHIYVKMMRLGIVIPYPKKMQNI